MAEGSLLAHLTSRFAPQPENLATEALCYILQRSPAARHALLEMCANVGAKLPSDLLIRTQSTGKDGAIPDAAGTDLQGRERLLIESKFWAGLTTNQPVTYIRRFEKYADLENGGGILLVVAPSLRLETLWAELLRLSRSAGLTPAETSHNETLMRATTMTGSNAVMALASWRTILDPIARALAAAQEVQLAEDLTQLRGLCERMDTEGFLPLTGEDLTTASPRRLLLYAPLIDDLVSRALTVGCNIQGLRAAATSRAFGRYMQLTSNKVGLFLGVDYRKWATLASTPIWLLISGRRGQIDPKVRDVLGPLEHEIPTRLFADPDNSLWVCVPMFPPIGEERDAVFESLFKQLVESLTLLELLPELSSGQGSESLAVLPQSEEQMNTLPDALLLDPRAAA